MYGTGSPLANSFRFFAKRLPTILAPRQRETMPITYNGIGTRYHGKSNLEIRPGACRSCGREGQLQSYDTRLWFVILFIPIIPLGRKRILDYCPTCRRHYVSDLNKWETARQLEVSGAMDKYRSNPTPENAIAAHQQMLGFHQVAEATELQKSMLAQFPDNAKVQVYLASALDHLGRRDQAAKLYERALELRSDLPEARMGIARGYIREGRLDDARKMLGFLEKSGSAQLYSLEPLETLARAYQGSERHQEALDLFEKIMAELPKVAEHPVFRKAVKKSEKALQRDRTILPKQKFSFKRIFQSGGRSGRPIATGRSLIAVGVIIALVILGFAVSNEYIRHHRTLYLVNGYDVPATVQIKGINEARNFTGLRDLQVPEGHFHAVITGPVQQELDFDVQDTYFNRWGGDPLWVINVGGGALLIKTEATYKVNPDPPSLSFFTGQTFQQFDTVTHPFKTLPRSVEVSDGGSRTLVELNIFHGEASGIAAYYRRNGNPGEALTFSESWLRAHPNDETLLDSYEETAAEQKQTQRMEAFLRSGLSNRPVQISWHRAYQNLHDHGSDYPALLASYDQMLGADPTNSALLYLRGRLETDRDRAHDFFQRSADGDPRNPFPLFALGFGRTAAGDWSGAKSLFERATELDSRNASFASELFTTRLALGEGSALEAEALTKLTHEPASTRAELNLLDALTAQGKTNEAILASAKFISLCQSEFGAAGDDTIHAIQYHVYYALGDFNKLNAIAAKERSAEGQTVSAIALIEQGRVDDAVKILPKIGNGGEKAMFSYAIAAAYIRSGNPDAASQWRQRGIEALRLGNQDWAQAADLLKRGTAPTRAEMESLDLAPELKAIMLAELCQEFPQARAELAGFARSLNTNRGFPYHLVRSIISEVQ